MQDTILSIAGKPGLYKLLSQGRGMLIVETVDAAKRRVPAGARDLQDGRERRFRDADGFAVDPGALCRRGPADLRSLVG